MKERPTTHTQPGDLNVKFPPLDLRRESPTGKDRDAANSGQPSIETKIAELVTGQKGGISTTAAICIGLVGGATIGVGATVGLMKTVFAAENVPIGAFPNSFNNDGSSVPKLVDLPPLPEQAKPAKAETEKVNPREGFDNSKEKRVENPNSIKAKKFRIPPPNRIPSEDTSPQHIPIDQLPTIKEYTAEYSRDGTYNNFRTGVGFIQEERTQTYISRRVTPSGLESIKQEFTRYPAAGVVGYTIGKEIQPDGSVLLAVYVPGKNGLSSQDGVDRSTLSVENISDDGNEGKLSNAIVWIKVENFKGYSEPFSVNFSWRYEGSMHRGGNNTEDMANIPEELFRYIKIGDPVSVRVWLQIHPETQDLLVKNYQDQKTHLTHEEAQKKYLDIVNSNAETIQRMLTDAKTGEAPSLKEQLETQRYILQGDHIRFVPRN